MTDRMFVLPPAVADLVAARNRLRDHYASTGLQFTLDGNLVGDIGEAIAAELFGVSIEPRSTKGIDGYAPNGLTVQVKATATGGGPAFRKTEVRSQHLLFFQLNVEDLTGEVIFNGPEEIALAEFPVTWVRDQRSLSPKRIRDADEKVPEESRLVRID